MRKKRLFRAALVFAIFFGGCLAWASLPVRAAEKKEAEAQAALVELEDGEYAVEVELSGGTGRAAVTSPAHVSVVDGHAYARIEWSSSRYDYMLADGQKYLPIQEEGNSVFEIPITAFDEPVEVTADTTAMGAPHEISYTLTFLSEGIASKNQMSRAERWRMVYILAIAAGICVPAALTSKKKRNAAK